MVLSTFGVTASGPTSASPMTVTCGMYRSMTFSSTLVFWRNLGSASRGSGSSRAVDDHEQLEDDLESRDENHDTLGDELREIVCKDPRDSEE